MISSMGTSPGNESNSADEFVDVIVDIQDDDIVALRSVDPVTISNTELRRFPRSHGEVARAFPATSSPARAKFDRTYFGAEKALRGLRFISNLNNGVDLWVEVQENLDKLAGDGYLHRSDFAECIDVIEGTRDVKEFAVVLFDALTRRRGLKVEKISREEVYEYWCQITDQSFDSRLRIFFDMVDKNEDGRIMEEEIKEIIRLSASANDLSGLEEEPEKYTARIMKQFDLEKLGFIELWQLEALFLQLDTYVDYNQELSQNLERSHVQRLSKKLMYFVQDKWRRIWVFSVWVMIMIGLFAWKFFQYKQKSAFQVMGYCLLVAKGAAETLKFNMALILLPVCRNTLTWLRSTKFSFFIPFDDNINFHKMIPAAIVIGVILHAGDHLACNFPRIINASSDKYNQFLSRNFGTHKPTYLDLVKGPEGVTGILMVICMASAFTLATTRFRRNQIKLPNPFRRFIGFNAFWYSHHLFVIVYILLIIHGVCLYLVHKWHLQTTWMYLAIPILLYTGERTLRFFRSRSYTVQILKVGIYPGNVLNLEMSKPSKFRYNSGQYIFVQCPAVSLFEWHPFYVTSAPGDDYLSVHIRTIGDWTRELKRVFTGVGEPPPVRKSGLLKTNETSSKSILPKLFIDGPYGAPAQDYKKYNVVLLVGLGIGATLFISILKDLLNNIIEMEEQADSDSDLRRTSDLSAGNNDSINSSGAFAKTKKLVNTNNAYFYWVTREQNSFEWFKRALREVSDLDQRRVIEMHNYVTSAYEEGSSQSAFITMVHAINHVNDGVDILSGTRLRTHFARPKWKKVLSELSSKHSSSRIGVFYCGAPSLGKELSKLCDDFNQKDSTKFEFHDAEYA